MGLRTFCLVTMIYCYHGWAQEQDLQENAVSNQKFERSFEEYNAYNWCHSQNGFHPLCGRVYTPVCGSDGRDYFNQCYLANRARCFDSSLTWKNYGRCKASKECEDDETKMDDCNYCYCGNGQWICTRMGCGRSALKAIPERSLVPGTPCKGKQFWPHPTNCLMYVQCGPSGTFEMNCPAGTAWSQDKRACDHLHNTDCDPSKPQRPDDKECDDSEPATYNGCNKCWCQGGHQVCTQMRCPQH